MSGYNKNKKALTFIEVMLAALLLAVILLPMFNFLTNSVKDTEKIYAEVLGISRAKMIMDTLLFQVPWRAIREGNPCRFEDPQKDDSVNSFLQKVIPDILGEGAVLSAKDNTFIGEGVYTSDKGFLFRSRIKVVDLDSDSLGTQALSFTIKTKSGDYKEIKTNELTSKDADGKYNLVKKIVIQVKWSLLKGKDPNDDPRSKSIFLVGFKSNLEG